MGIPLFSKILSAKEPYSIGTSAKRLYFMIRTFASLGARIWHILLDYPSVVRLFPKELYFIGSSAKRLYFMIFISPGVYVAGCVPGGNAAKMAKTVVGDKLVSVGDVDVSEATLEDVMALIAQAKTSVCV